MPDGYDREALNAVAGKIKAKLDEMSPRFKQDMDELRSIAAEDASGFIKDNYVNHTADEMAEAFDLLQQGIAVLLTSPD